MEKILFFELLSKKNRIVLLGFISFFLLILLIPKELMQAQHGLINYLPIHSALEIFSIIVSMLAFSMAWENRSENKYNTTIIVASTFFGVAIIDFAHVLSFPGMPNFVTPSSANKSIYFWLVGRFAIALSMVFLVSSTPKTFKSSFTKYKILLVTLLFCSFFYWIALLRPELLPDSFIEGEGLTTFKIYTEAVVVSLLIVAFIILVKRCKILANNYDLNNIIMAMSLMVFSELFFMLFTTHADLYNFLGHIYKAASYFYFYRALFQQSIQKPFAELDKKNQELQVAKLAAEKASIAKSQFLANISHEIRTPMNAILGLTEIIIETEDPKEKSEYIALLKQSEEHLLNLVNNVLTSSRMDTGLLDLHFREFNLHTELVHNEKTLKIIAAKKNLNFSLNIDPAVPTKVYGDLSKLNQVLINLIDNAIKFTDQGFIKVNVSSLEVKGKEVTILVCVQDSGIGIPADKWEILFQNFSQVDSSPTRQYGGTGLGLAISKKIIEALSGKIWLDSKPGVGSVFSFTMTLTTL